VKARMVLYVLAVCGGVALMPACRSVTSAGITVESYQQTQVKATATIFGRQFRVVQSAIARGDNGLLQATVTLANLRKDCQIEYRYRWLDDKGIEVRSGTSIWTPLTVGAREQKLLSGMAPSKNAADFILDMRYGFKSTRW
jgi:uncharacterized protein YcfL